MILIDGWRQFAAVYLFASKGLGDMDRLVEAVCRGVSVDVANGGDVTELTRHSNHYFWWNHT